MFVGPISDIPSSRSQGAGGAGSASHQYDSSSSSNNNPTRVGQDCLPRREPLTEVRAALARIESRSTASLLNPSNTTFSAFDRVTIAANASAGGIDADLPLNRPLAAIAQLSQRDASNNNGNGNNNQNNNSSNSNNNGSNSDNSNGNRNGGRRYQHQPRSEGAIEVFLASLGVDYRETQRMLQYVRASRVPIGGNGLGGVSGSGGATPHGSPALLGASGLAGVAGARRNADGTLDGSSVGPLATSTLDVEAFMRARRAESLGAAIRDVQQAMTHRERLSAGGTSNFAVDQLLQQQVQRMGSTASAAGSINPSPLAGGLKPGPTGSSLAASSPITLSATPLGVASESAKMQQNINNGMERALGLSSAVTRYPPSEWLVRFSGIAHNQVDSVDNGGELDDLWQSTQRILRYVPVSVSARSPSTCGAQASKRAGAHPLLLAVSGARRSLEYTFMKGVLKQIGWLDQQGVAPENIDPTRVGEAINKYCSTGRAHRSALSNVSAWTKVFYAMRCGQWNTAATLCPSPAVAAAIRDDLRGEDLAAECSSPIEGNNTRLAVAVHTSTDEMIKLYKDEATKKDPFRAAVLFILLRGRNIPLIGDQQAESHHETKELERIITQVTTLIDDTVWIRLALVECIEVSSNSNNNSNNQESSEQKKTQQTPLALLPFHGLKDFQASLLAENPASLVQKFGNNILLLANVFLHALLPSTALRAVMSLGGAPTVDAVHLGIVYYQRGLIVDGPSVAAERSVGFEDLLKNFVMSLVTVRSVSPARIDTPLLHTAYAYFRCLGLHESFVNVCASEAQLSEKLFGDLLPFNNISSTKNRENFASLINATQQHVSLSASNSAMDLLRLLNDVGQHAQIKGRSSLAARVSVICYAQAAVLARRTQDQEAEKISRDALSRAYGSTIPVISRSLLHTIAARCALIKPSTDFIVDGASVRAGSVPISQEVVQVARSVRDVVAAVDNLSVMHSVDSKLRRLTDQFEILMGMIDIIGAWDDKDDERVVSTFFSLDVVPMTESQIDASTQQLTQLPEFCVLLISRSVLLVQHSLERYTGACQLHRRRISQQQQGANNAIVLGEVGTQISKLEAQQDLIRTWFSRWSQRCRTVGTSGPAR